MGILLEFLSLPGGLPPLQSGLVNYLNFFAERSMQQFFAPGIFMSGLYLDAAIRIFRLRMSKPRALWKVAPGLSTLVIGAALDNRGQAT
jgi:hypothetical protein